MNLRLPRRGVYASVVLVVIGIVAIIVGCASQEKYNALRLENDALVGATAQGNEAHAQSSAWRTANPSPQDVASDSTFGRSSELASSGNRLFGANVSPPATRPVFSRGVRSVADPKAAEPDELWVVERNQRQALAQIEQNPPGSGSLLAIVPDQPQPLPFPLKHTDVRASVLGYIAAVDVTQQYHNPYSTKIEAVYVFPLPHNAAVTDFVMTIGERTIRGIIREREEAQRIYQQARSQGYVASLLTEERPNIFTQKVANIEPGKQIDVNITYFNTLTYADGWYEFAFPMVVGPRFNPPGMSDGVGAVERGAHGISGQKTEIEYLRPNERSGHDISLALDLNAGVRIEKLECRSHSAEMNTDGSQARIVLSRADSIPNRDFVLRWQIAGTEARSAMFTHRDARSGAGYFTLMLVPPAELGEIPRKPLEMVFTLDVSGSMSGRPIEQAKAAIRYSLRNMTPGDTFQVIKFASSAENLFPQPVPATPQNIQAALRFIDLSNTGGGTMMLEGIRNSLNFPHDPYRLRFVSFLTDGYIGNERQILREVHNSLGASRIFSFGVGNSVNRYLLDHLAKMGQGYSAYLALNDNAEQVMQSYFDRISHPAMTDVSVDFGGMMVSEVSPQRLPDLFVGRPVIITGKFTGNADRPIQIRGRIGNQALSVPVALEIEKAESLAVANKAAAHRLLPALWARAQIGDLSDRGAWDESPQIAPQIRSLALGHNLVSSYTSFVAVDSTAKSGGAYGMTVNVPVPVPDGVRYETTVQEGTNPPQPLLDR